MHALLKILRGELLRVVGEIDAGNSYLSEEDASKLIDSIRELSTKERYCTKYEACQYLNGISRATFDNLVLAGKLPRGIKLYAGDNTLFWKESDLLKYKQSIPKNKH